MNREDERFFGKVFGSVFVFAIVATVVVIGFLIWAGIELVQWTVTK